MHIDDWRQLDEKDDISNKTILKALVAYDEFVMVFTDKTFLYGEVSGGEEDATIEYGYPMRSYLLLQLGIISKEDYQAKMQAEEAAARRRQAEYEREQYERLKAKFEGK